MATGSEDFSPDLKAVVGAVGLRIISNSLKINLVRSVKILRTFWALLK